jgi:hypothetical protein
LQIIELGFQAAQSSLYFGIIDKSCNARYQCRDCAAFTRSKFSSSHRLHDGVIGDCEISMMFNRRKVDLYKPFFRQNPIQKELEHLSITGLGELDPFANQFLLLAFKQGVSQESGSVARTYLPSTVSFGERSTARPLPNREREVAIRSHRDTPKYLAK